MTKKKTVATESIHILITSYQTFLNAEQKQSLTLNIVVVDKPLALLWESV